MYQQAAAVMAQSVTVQSHCQLQVLKWPLDAAPNNVTTTLPFRFDSHKISSTFLMLWRIFSNILLGLTNIFFFVIHIYKSDILTSIRKSSVVSVSIAGDCKVNE